MSKDPLQCNVCMQAFIPDKFATLNVIESDQPGKAEIIGGPFCLACTIAITGFILKLQQARRRESVN